MKSKGTNQEPTGTRLIADCSNGADFPAEREANARLMAESLLMQELLEGCLGWFANMRQQPQAAAWVPDPEWLKPIYETLKRKERS